MTTFRRSFAFILLAAMFCLVAHAQRKDDTTAEVSGIVKGADGVPVVVHLRSLAQNPVRYYDGYAETTEKDGSFHFAQIAPGAYQFETATSGFMLAAPIPVTLRAGEKRRGVTIPVTPNYSLCGRVTENGAPKNNTWVNAYRYNPEFGTLSGIFFPHTGSDGSFRIPDVAPGTLYLEGYTTYYPGTIQFHDAKPLNVGAGAPTGCGYEIPLQYTGCHATKVSGRITAGDADAKYRLVFLSPNPAGGSLPAPIDMSSNNVYKAGDSFSTTVCPGTYDLVLSDQPIRPWGQSPTHKVVFATQRVEVGAAAIDGLELTPSAMASISGEAPGMSHGVACPGGGVRFQVSILREGDGQFQSAVLDDQNRFSFHNVAPGDYLVYVGPVLRTALYLDSILVNGKPIQGRRFTVAQAQPMTMVINISNDLAHAAGHLSPDFDTESRWEVGWTRPKGSVAGRVLGASPAGITVKLEAIRYNSSTSAEYTAPVDADGSFHFNTVDPGVYLLRAEGKNILTTEYGAQEAGKSGTPIVVARAARIRDLTLSPPKLSSICGRVTAAENIPPAQDRIFLKARNNKWSQEMYGSSPVFPDADGRFEIDGVPPGEYFLAATLGVNRIVYFSPDGTLGAATPVIVRAGQDVGCSSSPPLDLRAPANYKKTYAFAGKVSGDLPAALGDRFWVSLVDVHSSGAENFVATAKLDAGHGFSFDHVPGGRFVLRLSSAYGPEPMVWSGPYPPVTHLLASQTINVQDGPIEVTITPMPLPTVTGVVHFSHIPEKWKGAFDVAHQSISFVPLEYRAPPSARLSADGSFSIGPVDAGDYEVNLNLREPLYVKSVRLDGREIKGRYLHLSAGSAARLEVEVNGDSGEVLAHFVADTSLPMPEPPISLTCSRSARPQPQYAVFLFPQPLVDHPAAEQDPNSATVVPLRLLYRRTYGDDLTAQTVRARGVPPGSYRALVMQAPGLLRPLFAGRPDDANFEWKFWSALAALGQPVTVEAGGSVEVVLPDKTMDAVRLAGELGVSQESGPLHW